MTDHFAPEIRRRLDPLPRWLAPVFGGFLYWLVFLMVLEPDNVLRASQAGYVLPLGTEIARIIGAAVLAATVTPLLTWLTRRVPLAGGDRFWQHAAIHLICNICLALLLIVASCFLAAWEFERQLVPSLGEVIGQLVANWTLLVFALCALTTIVHLIPYIRRLEESNTTAAPDTATATSTERIPIKTGGRFRFLEQANIDWLETQGNYVTVHSGASELLVRRTLTDFETELDMRRFVRIHRRMIVAIDRIEEMKPLANGDAILQLRDGRELRMSRNYRDDVVRRWAEVPI